MAYFFPEGSRFLFAPLSDMSAAKAVSAISNTNPAIATAAAHSFTTNDELLFLSGWEDASNNIWKGTTIDAGSLSLQGLDATSTNQYPSGSGAGTLQKVITWTEIPQVLSIQGNGGDSKKNTIDPLSRRNAFEVPVGFNPMSMNLTLGHDASLPAYQKMVAISRRLDTVAFKVVMSGGAVGYGYGYLSVSEMPNITKGQANQVTAVISMLGRFITYAS